MEKGVVYTLRSATRAEGRTIAVEGSYAKYTTLCLVDVKKVITVRHPEDLYPDLSHSGFKDVNTWWSKAGPTARTLYRVDKYRE